MTNMPDKIFAGFMGGSRFWGEATPATHPDNTIYVRSDLIPQSVPLDTQAERADLKHGFVDILNQSRCLEGRTVGNLELANRLIDHLAATGRLSQSKPNQEQPEAIQKAVEALTVAVGYPAMVSAGMGTLPITKQRAALDAGLIGDALNGLSTHQSELEALKAENADLRHAVVDFETAFSDSEDPVGEADKVYAKHAAVIAKAKAVQDV